LAVISPFILSAQSFSPTAIVSAGNAATVNGTYVSWSVGETFVTTLSGGDIILTQGFQQPESDNDLDNDGFTADVDCDDSNAEINPAAIEICDALDNNCDGFINENLAVTYYADVDGDGYAEPYIITFEGTNKCVVRIATRFDDMLKGGLVEEVARLREEYVLESTMPSMRCVGYRQTWQHLNGNFGLDQLREQGIAATRQLAKRQLTWLARYEQLNALDPTEDSNLLAAALVKIG
jgi:hypothetical protein